MHSSTLLSVRPVENKARRKHPRTNALYYDARNIYNLRFKKMWAYTFVKIFANEIIPVWRKFLSIVTSKKDIYFCVTTSHCSKKESRGKYLNKRIVCWKFKFAHCIRICIDKLWKYNERLDIFGWQNQAKSWRMRKRLEKMVKANLQITMYSHDRTVFWESQISTNSLEDYLFAWNWWLMI